MIGPLVSVHHLMNAVPPVQAKRAMDDQWIGRTEDASEPEYAWSTGVQILAPGRAFRKDGAGVAFSRQVDADGTESVGEGYYRHVFTDRLALSFDLQWLFSGTNVVTGESNTNVVIPGLRAMIDF